MYRPITMYQLFCDRCGNIFGDTDTRSSLFADKCPNIEDYSDWKMIDGKYYCPECYEASIVNDTYTVKVKN